MVTRPMKKYSANHSMRAVCTVIAQLVLCSVPQQTCLP